ncbi:MAG TPA: helix-turn-helix transcriptional regulator [Saprospiraceae bacterium]|nr:helix-turn-helix transcriptional regulator [Saprospiraceae bacterium]
MRETIFVLKTVDIHTDNMKLTSIDKLTDRYVGKPGTSARDQFEYDLDMEILGAIIKDARKKKNLTQEQLGQFVGVQKAQISKLENNTKNFRIDTIIKVLDALGAKVKLSVEFGNKKKIVMAKQSRTRVAG